MYPMEAPTPIQYQYASGKIPRDFKTFTPNGSVELGGTCAMQKYSHIVIENDQHSSLVTHFYSRTCFVHENVILLLTCDQLFPRNSFTARAFCPYIMGENQ